MPSTLSDFSPKARGVHASRCTAYEASEDFGIMKVSEAAPQPVAQSEGGTIPWPENRNSSSRIECLSPRSWAAAVATMYDQQSDDNSDSDCDDDSTCAGSPYYANEQPQGTERKDFRRVASSSDVAKQASFQICSSAHGLEQFSL
ncbi:unnamed protein product, partial [Polarella glacialis]